MYTTSNEWKEKAYIEDTEHTMRVYVDNVEIDKDFVLGYSSECELFINGELCLGSTVQKDIELTLYKEAVEDVSTIKEVKLDYGMLINNEWEYIPIGTFIITEKPEKDDYTIVIKASDNMFKFNKTYNGKDIVPTDLKTVLQHICSTVGVELGTTNFINEDVEINVYDNTEKAREYVSYIAEQAGCFACIGRDGKLYLKDFFESETTINEDYLPEINWYEDYKISGVTYQDAIRNYTAGNDSNNMLRINPNNMYIVNQQQIDNIFAKIEGLEINGFEGVCLIDPATDIGDKVIIEGKSVIYQGKEEYLGKLKATISSRIQSKEVEDTVEIVGEKAEKRRLKTELDQANMTITAIAEEQSEHTNKLAQQQISIDEIEQKVSNVQEFSRDLSRTYQLVTEEAGNVNLMHFELFGKTELKSYVGMFFAGTGYATGNSKITLVIDKQSRENISAEAIVREYNVPQMLNKGDVADKLVVEVKENGKNSVKLLKYIKLVNNKYVVLEEPEITILEDDIDLTLFEGINYIYVKEHKNWKMSAKYLIKSDYNKYYATRVETEAKIEQKADEINIEVAKKVDEDEVIAAINLTSEEAKINANKITLAGKEINLTSDNMSIKSNNFNVDTSGNMTCNDATMNNATMNQLEVNGGYIELTDTSTEGELDGDFSNFVIISGEGDKKVINKVTALGIESICANYSEASLRFRISKCIFSLRIG